jgi:hypothetical protein
MDVSKGLTFIEARNKISTTFHEILASSTVTDVGSVIVSHTRQISTLPVLAVVLYVIAIILMADSYQAEVLTALVAIVAIVLLNACLIRLYHKSQAVEVHSALQAILKAYDAYCITTDTDGVVPTPGGELGGSEQCAYLTSGHSQVSIVHVYRDGHWLRIPILLLAEGDIIALMGGDIAPGHCCEIERATVEASHHHTHSHTHHNLHSAAGEARTEVRWKLGKAMQPGEKVLIRNKRYFSQLTPQPDDSPVILSEDCSPRAAAAAETEVGAGGDASNLEQSGDEGGGQHSHFAPNVAEFQLHDEDHDHAQPSHAADGVHRTDSGHADYGNRHRTLGAESVEILSLCGDVRCFRMTETPVAAFVRRAVLGQEDTAPGDTNSPVDPLLLGAQNQDYALLRNDASSEGQRAVSLIRTLFHTLVVDTGTRVLFVVLAVTAAGMLTRYLACHFRDGGGAGGNRAGWARYVVVPVATACVFFLPLALPLALVLTEATATAEVLASAEVTLGHTHARQTPAAVNSKDTNPGRGRSVDSSDARGAVPPSAPSQQHDTDLRRRRAASGSLGSAEDRGSHGASAEEDSLSDQFVDEDLDDRAEDIADEVSTQVTWTRYLAYVRRVLWHRLLLHWNYRTTNTGGVSQETGGSEEEWYLPVPLARTRLLEVLGAVTMVCFVDDDVICEGYSVTEEIFLLMDDHQSNQGKGATAGRGGRSNTTANPADLAAGKESSKQEQSNVKGIVLDLHANPEATGSRFENPQWWRYLPSLKPLGLNALLTYTYTAAAATLTSGTPDERTHHHHHHHSNYPSEASTPTGLGPGEGRAARGSRSLQAAQSMYAFHPAPELPGAGAATVAPHSTPKGAVARTPLSASSPVPGSPLVAQQQQHQHTDRSLVRHIRHILPQEALRELAEEIGFEQSDLSSFSRVLEVRRSQTARPVICGPNL